MSKKARRPSKIEQANINQLVTQSLRVDFSCSEEQVELIEMALLNKVPVNVLVFMNMLANGKAPVPIRRGELELEMPDGKIGTIKIANHPLALLHDFLVEEYDWRFGTLYWSAFTFSHSPKKYYDYLKYLLTKEGKYSLRHPDTMNGDI